MTQQQTTGKLFVRLDERREAWVRQQAVRDARNINMVLALLIDRAIAEQDTSNDTQHTAA